MKKLVLTIVILLGLLLGGCSPEKQVEPDKPEKPNLPDKGTGLVIGDYYPFLENTILEYEGRGIEFAEELVYFEFIEGNKAQLKIKNPGTNIVKILENKDGVLKEIFSEGEFYHVDNLLKEPGTMENILLKEPLEIGNSWTDAEGDTREITGLDVEIETPYKTLKALEVTTTKGNSKTREYYTVGIGRVASIYEDGDVKIETLLRSIRQEAIKLSIDKYYPIDIDSDIVYVEDEISFKTNGDIRKELEEAMKNPPSDKFIPLISQGTKLNSINLDRNTWTLKLDFSPELLSEMNYGSNMESKILQGIVATMGKFYGVEGVSLTIDGRAYESGHHYFKEDEILEIDVKDIKKIEP